MMQNTPVNHILHIPALLKSLKTNKIVRNVSIIGGLVMIWLGENLKGGHLLEGRAFIRGAFIGVNTVWFDFIDSSPLNSIKTELTAKA